MDVALIIQLALQVLAQLPAETALVQNAFAALSSNDQDKLKAMLAPVMAASDAQHQAAQGL